MPTPRQVSLLLLLVAVCTLIYLQAEVQRVTSGNFQYFPSIHNGVREEINVVFSIDENRLQFMPTVLNSLWKNTNREMRVTIIYMDSNISHPIDYLSCYLEGVPDRQIRFVSVNASDYIRPELYAHMNRHHSPEYTSRASNYIRFYFHRLFPDVDRILYLDTDVLVMDDVGELWDLTAHHDTILSAYLQFPNYPADSRGNRSSKMDWSYSRLGLSLNKTIYCLQAGVFVMNLDRLRQQEDAITHRLLTWAEGDIKNRWWSLDTQSLMCYTFYDEVTDIPARWNIGALRDFGEYLRTFNSPGIIHFYGKKKPWHKGHVRHKEVWKRHVVHACSRHGDCHLHLGGDETDPRGMVQNKVNYHHSETDPRHRCTCHQGYTGALCQLKVDNETDDL